MKILAFVAVAVVAAIILSNLQKITDNALSLGREQIEREQREKISEEIRRDPWGQIGPS